MPRQKLYAARLNLNLTNDVVQMMMSVQAQRAGTPEAIPARIYREALAIGLRRMLGEADNGPAIDGAQLDELAEVLERIREQVRPVGRFLTRLEHGADVLERVAAAAPAIDVLERLGQADDGIDALERLASAE